MRVDGNPFEFTISADRRTRVIRLSGELDLASRDVLDAACFAGEELDVHIDLSDVTFMDCAGYRSLQAARLGLEAQGGSLSVDRANGQPSRLFALLAEIEQLMPGISRSDAGAWC